jgi:hypothetical protein
MCGVMWLLRIAPALMQLALQRVECCLRFTNCVSEWLPVYMPHNCCYMNVVPPATRSSSSRYSSRCLMHVSQQARALQQIWAVGAVAAEQSLGQLHCVERPALYGGPGRACTRPLGCFPAHDVPVMPAPIDPPHHPVTMWLIRCSNLS